MFLMLFTVGTMTAASMGVLGINDTTQKTMKASDDARILTLWENSIGAALVNGGTLNELVPPAGEIANAKVPFTTPPSWISAPRNNAYGFPIIYCPVSQKGILDPSLPVQVLKTPGGSYQANIISASNGHDYVLASNIALDASIVRTNVLAFVISQLGENTPSCTDVIYNTEKGKFYVKNNAGVVRTITPASKINNGNDGTQPNKDKVNFSSAVSGWALTTNADYIIDAAQSGSFSDTVTVSKYDTNNTLEFRSNSNTVLSATGKGMSLDGVKLVLINIDASQLGVLSINNGEIISVNSTLPSLKMSNSKITFKGVNNILGTVDLYKTSAQITGSTLYIKSVNNVNLTNSTLSISDSSTLTIDTTGKTPLNLISGSDFKLNDSSLNIKGNSANSDFMIFIDPGSKFIAYSSTISLNSKATWGIFNQGLLQLNGSSLIPSVFATYLVGVYDGGRIFADMSNIGSAARKNSYGVVIESSNYASGSQTNVYSSSQCLAGTAYNSFKKVPASIANSYSWSCK